MSHKGKEEPIMVISLDTLTKMMEEVAERVEFEDVHGGLYDTDETIQEIQDKYLREVRI